MPLRVITSSRRIRHSTVIDRVNVDTKSDNYAVRNGVARQPDITGVSYLDIVAALDDARTLFA